MGETTENEENFKTIETDLSNIISEVNDIMPDQLLGALYVACSIIAEPDQRINPLSFIIEYQTLKIHELSSLSAKITELLGVPKESVKKAAELASVRIRENYKSEDVTEH